MNSVQLMGRLGKDPEVRYTQGGAAVAQFSLATDGYRNKEKVTDWHRVVCFNKTAEAVKEHLRKGSGVAVEGRLQTRSYDKDGEKRYVTEVVANRVHFLPGQKTAPKQEKAEPKPEQAEEGFDSDIPF